MRQLSKNDFSAKNMIKIFVQARYISRAYYCGFQFLDANIPLNESFIIRNCQDPQIIDQLDKNIFLSKQHKKWNVIHFLLL